MHLIYFYNIEKKISSLLAPPVHISCKARELQSNCKSFIRLNWSGNVLGVDLGYLKISVGHA
jgi:hypothetical protein